MSHWKHWEDERSAISRQLGNVEQIGPFTYPNLHDGSYLMLASDYSGEHAHPEFLVLSFLLTTRSSVMNDWDPLRSAVRRRHLADGRRISFKDLNDALRINALPAFLDAASQLNGVLVCIGVEKTHSLPQDHLPPLQHDWKPDSLKKLVEVCAFGAGLVDGLRNTGQDLHWITDDDAIVSTENAQCDAVKLFGGLMHTYPNENPQCSLGIASKFDDDRLAEDLVAIPDLAAGAFSEMLTTTGKSNIPLSGSGLSRERLFLQIKSTLINAWRSQTDAPLKHFHVLVRAADRGQSLFSFGIISTGIARKDEVPGDAPQTNSKWRRALGVYLESQGIDTSELLESIGIDV